MRLGSHHSNEARKKISLAKENPSMETRTKLSLAHKGRTESVETRQKISDGNKGRLVTWETREKISVANKGHALSPETREKLSIAHKGKVPSNKGVPQSLEQRTRQSAAMKGKPPRNWKGGRRVSTRKQHARRRLLGFVQLNEPFEGCEGHHLDNERIINMQKALHRSVYHRQSDGRGMAKINAIAYNFLFKQEVEEAIRQQQQSAISQKHDDATYSTERCSSQRSSS